MKIFMFRVPDCISSNKAWITLGDSEDQKSKQIHTAEKKNHESSHFSNSFSPEPHLWHYKMLPAKYTDLHHPTLVVLTQEVKGNPLETIHSVQNQETTRKTSLDKLKPALYTQ